MRHNNSNRRLGEIVELRATAQLPDFERTTTISKLVTARGELEDVLSRHNKRTVDLGARLELAERQSLRDMIKTINCIVLRLEDHKKVEEQANRVV